MSLQPIYNEPWFPYAIGFVGLLLAISVFKTIKQLPKLVMYPIIFATVVIVLFNWLYYRSEPAFLSPVMEALAPFFPSAKS